MLNGTLPAGELGGWIYLVTTLELSHSSSMVVHLLIIHVCFTNILAFFVGHSLIQLVIDSPLLALGKPGGKHNGALPRDEAVVDHKTRSFLPNSARFPYT